MDCCCILQVAICNVHVRHGILMLVPEVIEVLGGMVEELEEARKRLVNEINKPPRGKRYDEGPRKHLLFEPNYQILILLVDALYKC